MLHYFEAFFLIVLSSFSGLTACNLLQENANSVSAKSFELRGFAITQDTGEIVEAEFVLRHYHVAITVATGQETITNIFSPKQFRDSLVEMSPVEVELAMDNIYFLSDGDLPPSDFGFRSTDGTVFNLVFLKPPTSPEQIQFGLVIDVEDGEWSPFFFVTDKMRYFEHRKYVEYLVRLIELEVDREFVVPRIQFGGKTAP